MTSEARGTSLYLQRPRVEAWPWELQLLRWRLPMLVPNSERLPPVRLLRLSQMLKHLLTRTAQESRPAEWVLDHQVDQTLRGGLRQQRCEPGHCWQLQGLLLHPPMLRLRSLAGQHPAAWVKQLPGLWKLLRKPAGAVLRGQGSCGTPELQMDYSMVWKGSRDHQGCSSVHLWLLI